MFLAKIWPIVEMVVSSCWNCIIRVHGVVGQNPAGIIEIEVSSFWNCILEVPLIKGAKPISAIKIVI